MKKSENKSEGLTLVEIMVVIGIIAIVFWGVIKVFNRSISIWLFGQGQLDMQDKAREAMYWIGQDFRNAKASSMGNLGQNPGFEEPLPMAVSPLPGWEGAIGSGYFVQRIGPSGPSVKGGFRSIKLNAFGNTTDYFSNVITIPETKSYIISCWAKADNVIANFSLVQGDKTNFVPAIITSNNNNYWVHLATITSLNIGQQTRLKFNYPSSSWTLSLNAGGNDRIVTDMCIFKEKLYVGHEFDGNLYVFDNSSWNIARNFSKYVQGLCVYNDGSGEQLYVTWAPNVGFGGMYRYNGTIWAIFNVPANIYFYKMYSFLGKLYAACYDTNVVPAKWKIFAYDPGVGTWTQKFELTDSSEYFSESAFYVYYGRLYIGSGRWVGPGTIYSTSDGNTWTPEYNIADSRGVRSWCEFNGKLYGGVDCVFNAKIYTFDGSSWNLVYTFPLDYKDGPALYTLEGQLYAGTGACLGGGPYINAGRIFIRGANDFTWTEIWNSGHVGINGLITYNEKLFASCGDIFFGANPAKTYVFGGASYFDDVNIAPQEITFPGATTYEYYISYTTGPPSGNQWKKYSLRYEVHPSSDTVAPGILYRLRQEGANWVYDGLKPLGILCENVKSFKVTNYNQETFEVELVLEKEVSAGKKREYRLKNTFTPLVP